MHPTHPTVWCRELVPLTELDTSTRLLPRRTQQETPEAPTMVFKHPSMHSSWTEICQSTVPHKEIELPSENLGKRHQRGCECPDFNITLRRHQLYLPSSDLEHYFGTDFTSAILQEGTDSCPHPRKIKEDISSKDRDLLLAKHEGRADMSIVVEVESEIGWPRLWDLTLDNGARCIKGLRNLLRVITFPPNAMHACPLCEREDICRNSLLSHVLNTRTNCHLSSQELLRELSSVTDADSVFFNKLFQN